MISRVNSVVWTGNREDEESASWTKNNINNSISINNGCVIAENKDDMGPFSTFKSMLVVEDEWHMSSNRIQNHPDFRDIAFSPNLSGADNLLLHPVDSSSSCSPSSSVFNNLDPSQVHFFFPPKPTLSSLLNVAPNNPLDHGLDLGCEPGFLDTQSSDASNLMNRGGGFLHSFSDFDVHNQISPHNLSSNPQFPNTYGQDLQFDSFHRRIHGCWWDTTTSSSLHGAGKHTSDLEASISLSISASLCSCSCDGNPPSPSSSR